MSSAVEKIAGVNATRMELLGIRNRKALANKGYELLNKKLETLTSELFSILQKSREVNEQIAQALKDAFKAYTLTEMSMGTLKVRETAYGIPDSVAVEAKSRSLMGVRVPKIVLQRAEVLHQLYSFTDTSVLMDDAIKKLSLALELLVKLSEVQSTISRLASEIVATKRRVNALKNIVIPRFDATILWISLTLAEREREEFVRLKKVKLNLERANMPSV